MTELARLLIEAFPDWKNLPAGCWAQEAVTGEQVDFASEIAAVTDCSERSPLVQRIPDLHPLDREHLRQHDDRVIDTFTEAQALAWGIGVADLGCPRFVPREGAPDLEVGD